MSRTRFSRERRKRDLIGCLYLLPAICFFTLFLALPAFQTLGLSFFNWDGVGKVTYAGVSNYLALVTNPLFVRALINSVVLLIFFTVIPIGLALLIVGIVGHKKRKGLTFLRAIYFVPQVMPLIAIGIVWRWIYLPGGVFDQVFHFFHLPTPDQGWLGSFSLALPSIGIVGTWLLYGVCLTLFLSGVQSIDPTLFDAVTVDGGGQARQFFAITLPSLRREISLAAALTGIAALASFDLVYITTLGGPGNSTVVPGLLIYQVAFTDGQIGAAAALAVALMAITACYVLLTSFINPDRGREK